MNKAYRYRTAAESQKPGYLAKRFKAFKRLQRIKDRKASVQPIRKAA